MRSTPSTSPDNSADTDKFTVAPHSGRRQNELLTRLFVFFGGGRRGLSAGLGAYFQVVFEASGVDEAADGVVGEVAESQGDAA